RRGGGPTPVVAQWEGKEKGASLPKLALGPNATAVALHDRARDGQAKPRAHDPLTGVGADSEELLEQAVQMLRRDADALIGNAYGHFVLRHLAAHDDQPSGRRILHGVLQQ